MDVMSSLRCGWWRAVLAVVECLLIMVWGVVAASAKQYTVGDSAGWNLGIDYTTWASQYNFTTQDSLKFSYSGGVHTVQQVTVEDYKACNSANAISSGTSGTTVVKLDKAQTYYFICGVTSHCQGGMQLSVIVGDGSTSKSAPSPTSVPTKQTTPSSATTSPTTPTTSSPLTPSTPKQPSIPSKSPSLLHPSFSFLLMYFFLFFTAFTIGLCA